MSGNVRDCARAADEMLASCATESPVVLLTTPCVLRCTGCLENGWNVNDAAELQRWRDQEPINAHSHFAAMLLGSSETVPVTGGKLVLGEDVCSCLRTT